MLKLAGALLLVGAGTMLGWMHAGRLADRPAQIRRLVRMLGQLETEIAYGYTPLPEALARIGRQPGDPLADLFHEAADRLAKEEAAVTETWRLALESVWGRTALKNGEKEIMLTLGNTLGASDREDQIRHLRLAAKQLETLEPEAAEEQRKYEKMWKSLGLLGGALVAVILY
jgi:stage III sporulation protein AB